MLGPLVCVSEARVKVYLLDDEHFQWLRLLEITSLLHFTLNFSPQNEAKSGQRTGWICSWPQHQAVE